MEEKENAGIETINTEDGMIAETNHATTSETETEAIYYNANGDPSIEEQHISLNKMDFADMIGGEAEVLYTEYKLLPSAITAIAIYESLWGISDAATVNNYFNLEYSKGCGSDCQIFFYKEEGDIKPEEGAGYTIAFRRYASLHEGIADYEKEISIQYPDLKGETDYREVLLALYPDYAEQLIMLVEQYRLNERYDIPVLRN